MRHGLSILLLLTSFLLVFGCLEEKPFPGAVAEHIANTQSVDLDNDGSADYVVYDFAPVTPAGSSMQVQRQVTVSVQTASAYTQTNPDLSNVDLLVADKALEEFTNSRVQGDGACSANLGLLNVVCSDVVTCSKLCSAQSQRCKKIADTYEDVLAGSMISYVQDNGELRSDLVDARRMVLTLGNATLDEKNRFLGKLRSIEYLVANINANPLYTAPALNLCEHSDFGVPYLASAAGIIGNYTTQNSNYRYSVTVSVTPSKRAAGTFGSEVGGIAMTDSLPKSLVPLPDRVTSIQAVTANDESGSTVVRWSSTKPSSEGYMFTYEFTSTLPPAEAVPLIKTPDLKVRQLNLVALVPTNIMYTTLMAALRNYYLALGMAIGLTIAGIIFIYNVLVLLAATVREKAAGGNLLVGFRKAFGRTNVSWRLDLVLAAGFLSLGYYVCVVIAVQPAVVPSLLESVDYLLRNTPGVGGAGCMAIGLFMLYFAVDNFIKIAILERVYGAIIKQEKNVFEGKADELKSRIEELKALVEEYSKEDFDVSKEYDTLTVLRSEKMDVHTKEMTARSKAIIEERLAKAEGAVESLKERKHLADENWARWKETIAKLLAENNEVSVSMLVTVPASLRSWALGKYAKEATGEGISFERDSLKRKKMSTGTMVRDLINRDLLCGAMIVVQDKVTVSEFSEGGGTVIGALALKLRAYMAALAKNLGQHPPTSFVAVGDKLVLVIMKGKTSDSVLFVKKDKFNQAIEQWKTNMKTIEGG